MKFIYLIWFIIFFSACGQNNPQNVLILENGYYFNGAAFISFEELIITDSIITAINTKKTAIKGKRVKLSGKYVIPGLIDAHVHLSGSPSIPVKSVPQQVNSHSSLLCGITTQIDLFSDEQYCKELKTLINANPAAYSGLLLSGPMLTAPGGHGTEYGVATRTITNASDAAVITDEVINNEVDLIKVVYEAHSNKNALTEEILKTVVQTAHKRETKIFAHINVTAEAVTSALTGVDVLAHMPRDLMSAEQAGILKQTGVIIIPTISVARSYHSVQDADYYSHTLLRNSASDSFMQFFNVKNIPPPPYPDSILMHAVTANLKSCIVNNIPILAGTDAGNFAVFYGYSLHKELEYYVSAGMSPGEALNTATRNIRYVFPEIKKGIIAPGFDADLLILNKNPLEDIRNTKEIYAVYHSGIKVHNTSFTSDIQSN